MPLLDILGVDGLDQGFTVGISFMNAEIEEGYSWAITHLRSLFQPNLQFLQIAMKVSCMQCSQVFWLPIQNGALLLARYLGSKNVVANCKKFFEAEEAWEPFLKKLLQINGHTMLAHDQDSS